MKVILCSYFKYPDGDAGSVRHEKFAQMLQRLGHDVFVVGIGNFNNFQIASSKGIEYTSLRYSKPNIICKIQTRLLYWKNFKRFLCEYNPDCIIMDDMRPFVTLKLKKYCKKHQIKLVHDSVEWYSKEQFSLGVFSISLQNKNLLNRVLIDKQIKVISISQYLHKYYSNKGIESVNIPIVVSDEDLVKEKSLQDKINFTYAGQAGKKDYIHVILNAMSLLTEEERSKFQFNIVGCTLDQLIKNGLSQSIIDIVKKSLVVCGRVPRSKVLEVLKETDFTILMRSPVQRYAKAGFPTKAVESFAHSTPMIANVTSDLGKYMIDGYNSFVVEECSPEALALVLKKVLDLSLEQREEMCKNAYDTAVTKLHYNNFLEEFKYIIK